MLRALAQYHVLCTTTLPKAIIPSLCALEQRNDTALSDANGKVVFAGKPQEEGGKYAVVLPGPKFFEFLMVDEPMEFETTAANPSGDLEVIASKENEVFFGYLEFIQGKRTERSMVAATAWGLALLRLSFFSTNLA